MGENDIRIPLNYTQCAQKAAQNPVAVAKEFQALAENVTQILLGCPLAFQASTNSYQKRTWFFHSKKKVSMDMLQPILVVWRHKTREHYTSILSSGRDYTFAIGKGSFVSKCMQMH